MGRCVGEGGAGGVAYGYGGEMSAGEVCRLDM